MAIDFVAIKCPSCGANQSVEDGREMFFCSYCGTKVVLHNENEHIFRTIDEAAIRAAETDRMVRMRELDMEEKSGVSKKVKLVLLIIGLVVSLTIGIIGFSIDNEGMGLCVMFAIMAVVGIVFLFSDTGKAKNKRIAGPNDVTITDALFDNYDRNVKYVYALFRSVGFGNIQTIPLNDLSSNNLKKNNLVENISINGQEEFEEGDIFPKDAIVLITYHCRYNPNFPDTSLK